MLNDAFYRCLSDRNDEEQPYLQDLTKPTATPRAQQVGTVAGAALLPVHQALSSCSLTQPFCSPVPGSRAESQLCPIHVCGPADAIGWRWVRSQPMQGCWPFGGSRCTKHDQGDALTAWHCLVHQGRVSSSIGH